MYHGEESGNPYPCTLEHSHMKQFVDESWTTAVCIDALRSVYYTALDHIWKFSYKMLQQHILPEICGVLCGAFGQGCV